MRGLLIVIRALAAQPAFVESSRPGCKTAMPETEESPQKDKSRARRLLAGAR